MIETMTDTAISHVRPHGETPERQPSGKQRILETAERLFATRGFLDVSAAEIVREAGVAHGLLFHHFGSMEGLYAEVSRAAAQQMNEAQQHSFRGRTARDRIASFLRAHLKAVKSRQGDALFRARSHNLAINADVADIWEASRQQAIGRICEVLGIPEPTKKVRACLRAWIGFHDQLVLAWLADRSVSESEVLELTLRQLGHLASEVLSVDLDRTA
ncbi:AcrR family transcriptional regulator [Variovorax boronicumulans]|uniref:TetR/AcrR family transcriptional regulator n=1 Tax=Variovorax boronicumulans TaxID=436515 RepID=UPI00159DF09D|nr:TetR/AcrR family transcriptional regulator [Variovorax boronicumulans]MDQ0017376.1 AcrR family transcriptional regulator [Variovorax boronicumulans]